MDQDDKKMGNTPHPRFTMSDMDSHVRKVNLNNQISDGKWDSIIRTLNSEFVIHNASPEAICDSVKSAIDKTLAPKKGHSRWDVLWTCGLASVVVASASLLGWAIIEVMKYKGG